MSKCNNKGLTLIELIVVIGFLGLLLSISLPKIEKSPYILLYTTKTLRDDIRNIKYAAMTEGTGARIVFDRYSYMILEGEKIIKTVNLNKDLRIKQNLLKSSIGFDFKGTPISGGGTVSIVDESTKKYCKITIVPATGRILMENKIYK